MDNPSNIHSLAEYLNKAQSLHPESNGFSKASAELLRLDALRLELQTQLADYKEACTKAETRADQAEGRAKLLATPAVPQDWHKMFCVIANELNACWRSIHDDNFWVPRLQVRESELRAMLAATPAPAPAQEPVTMTLTERERVKCLVDSGCIGTVKMTYDSGPYEITRTSINADRLIESVIAALRAKGQS